MNDPVVIGSAGLTPIGAVQGELAGHQLGSIAIRAAVVHAGVSPEWVDEVLVGSFLLLARVRRRLCRPCLALDCWLPLVPQPLTRCAAPA
jgi:acetyl-CoA acetyltransferase